MLLSEFFGENILSQIFSFVIYQNITSCYILRQVCKNWNRILSSKVAPSLKYREHVPGYIFWNRLSANLRTHKVLKYLATIIHLMPKCSSHYSCECAQTSGPYKFYYLLEKNPNVIINYFLTTMRSESFIFISVKIPKQYRKHYLQIYFEAIFLCFPSDRNILQLTEERNHNEMLFGVQKFDLQTTLNLFEIAYHSNFSRMLPLTIFIHVFGLQDEQDLYIGCNETPDILRGLDWPLDIQEWTAYFDLNSEILGEYTLAKFLIHFAAS